MSDRYRTFLALGAPGSGKGTIGKALGAIPRFFHFSCGDAFRQLDTRTEIGQAFLQHSSRGELVPDELTVRFWNAQIGARVQTRDFKPDIDFLILDGIPRNVPQAKLMAEHMDVIQVFHLSCPDRDELAYRLRKRALKDNRPDDASEAVIRHRISTYEAETKPILDYYGEGAITDIDASQPPAKVLCDILASIMSLPVWDQTLASDTP
jgi:adenylate kinase